MRGNTISYQKIYIVMILFQRSSQVAEEIKAGPVMFNET